MKRYILTSLIISCLCIVAKAAVSVGCLRAEQTENPTGIDVVPRLSWKISSDRQRDVMQTGYRIIVASSPQQLTRNEGDLWDSGKVSSDVSHLVAYGGTKLKSNQRCYWKVEVYTNKGETGWSEAAFWSMGLLGETHWKGRWIGMDRPAPWDSETQWSRLSARYLRREFKTEKQIKQATVHIAGLGLYELFINGRRIGEQVLAPVPTDYRKTVVYNSFDVTPYIKEENAIGVTLGNGRFYTMRQDYKPYKIAHFGYPKMRLNLIIEYADGTSETIASDTDWKITADGPIRSNNEYDGEDYDARKELGRWTETGYNDAAWTQAERVSIPQGTLRAAATPNMKIVDRIKPQSIRKTGDKYILDMGQNMAGWIRMRIKGNNGDTLTLRFGERLEGDELYVKNLRDALSTDHYIVRGNEDGSEWAPRFVYHGFRYVELSGYKEPAVDDFTGEVVSDEMDVLGNFECSDELLNRIYRNARWGILGNYKGMPVDCPQRNERQPWLGDHAVGSVGESFIFDNANLYAKWMDDICQAQREDGCIPDVAPAFWNYYSDNMTWPATLPIACEMLYNQFGDLQPIVKSYPAMKKWIAHITSEYMTDDYIITKDKYGDWCVPPESLELIHSKDSTRRTDGSLIATAYACKVLQLMTRFAELQHFTEDARRFQALHNQIGEAFNRKFLTVKKGTSRVPEHILYPDSIFYGNNTVTANILPMAFDLVPPEYREQVGKNIVNAIINTNHGRISTGVIGTQWLMRTLSAMGRADIACVLATNKAYPSWGYMVENGATTIWELWNGNTANPEMNSGNHVMLLGDLIAWYYENLGGIRTSTTGVGFKHILFKPDFDIQELSNVNVDYETPYGRVKSHWKKSLTHLHWEIEVPCNTTAEVWLPNGKIEKTGSGSYTFDVEIPQPKAVLANEFLYEKTSFPECHASTIAETPAGDLVAAFFGGTKERNPDCCIWVCRKEKGSDVWTAPVEVANGVFSPTERKACWNPVLFQLPDKGDLLLFYKIGVNVAGWKGYLKRSTDGGKTWSAAEELPEGFLGPIKNKPEFINGRIICPSSTEGEKGWHIHFELSDDLGKTWRYVGPIPSVEPTNCIQPSILKLKDGRLQVLARTRNCKLATSYSSDNGETWSDVTLTDLPNNNSGTDAVTLKDGRHLLIYNDVRTFPEAPKGPRTPLRIALSKDDGKTWKNVITLEDSPVSQYSYPAIIQGSDGSIHVVYTWRRQRIKYVRLGL